nr:DNA-binding protein WhiA [Lachnospiraceae bacterium]
MSFSGEIKEELLFVSGAALHCRMAELAACFQFCGRIGKEENGLFSIKFQTENKIVARKCFTLLKKTFKIDADVVVRRNSALSGGLTYLLKVSHPDMVRRVLEALKVLEQKESGQTSGMLLKSSCCKRAFLRGAYLTAGSMSDPNKSYHVEIVCQTEVQANQIMKLLQDFSLDAKTVLRKKYYVVYMKEGENIADFLNIIEAHKALMEFENTRILKGVRNMVNRKVNCDAANINKTVNAAARQVEDIKFIQSVCGLEKLPDNLREMAYVRLENPEVPLGELGKLLDPPVGKSGVNHRLRKIGEFAKDLRG